MGRRSSDVEKLPDYVTAYRDRHGKRRYRYRRAGSPDYHFKAHPGTPKNPSAECLAVMTARRPANDAPRAVPGTINDLVQRYYSTTSFTNPAPVTREKVRAVLEEFRGAYGNLRVASLRFNHVETITKAKRVKRTNAAGRHVGGDNAAKFLEKHLRRLFDYAIKLEMIETNPVRLADRVRVPKTTGFHTWTEGEIAQYRARHPVGTMARAALEIVLWTLLRRSDARQFGPQHRKDGLIHAWNEKTKKMTWVPEPIQLTAAIDALPVAGLTTVLITEFGKPFSPKGFGNWFKRRCAEAGLPHCTLHGLRKATARRLAEIGTSQQGIKAAGNWSGDREVATYVADADQKRLAVGALTELAEWDLANPG